MKFSAQTGIFFLCFVSACLLSDVVHSQYAPLPLKWPTPNPLIEAIDFPSRFDWRENNGFTEAKNQGAGNCYPCWAFSLIGAAESARKLQTHQDVRLSEQQLLDCNTNGYGCSGGFVDGWTALRDYGAVLQDCYPFVAHDQDCLQSACEPVGWFPGVYRVPYSEKSIKYALMFHGCLSCSMTVYNSFMFYSGGCYENDGTQAVNHGVLIVGWDDSLCDGQGAWMVKNSWGAQWGDGGVAYMKYGDCNIGRQAQWFEYSDRQPDSGLHYGLFMPCNNPAAGDWFVLETRMGNSGKETIHFLEFIVLGAFGEYWFYPGFSQRLAWTDRTLDPDEYLFDVLLAFQWPENVGAANGIRFWGACMDANSYDWLRFDMVEFGSAG
jgi:hypothetical protein